MLIQLTYEQIAEGWPLIRATLNRALLPVIGEDGLTYDRILEGLLNGALQCWVSFDYVDEEKAKKKVDVVLITQIVTDEWSGSKSLYIYSLAAVSKTSPKTWIDGLKALMKWGRSRGCSRVIAHSNNEDIIKRVDSLGADTSYRFISFPIPVRSLDESEE